MNILILSNKAPYPLSDGGAIAIMDVACGLSELGHSVHLLYMKTQKHNTAVEDIPVQYTQKIRFSSEEVPAQITAPALLTNFLFSKQPYTATRFVSKEYEKKLIQILQETAFDIVQLEGLYLSPYISTIRSNSQAKIVMRAHNVEYKIWKRLANNTSNPLKKWYLNNLSQRIKHLEQRYFKDYDLLLPITTKDQKYFTDWGYQGTIHTLHTGIQLEHYPIGSQAFLHNSIFHLGSLDWIPNLESLEWFLKNVWPLILQKNKDIQFFIAGRNASKKSIAFFQSQTNVIYEGEVEDAKEYMQSRGVMLVPLKSGSGLRIKILEGMALAVPCVSTSMGIEGIEVKDGQELLIADTPETFAEKVLQFINNPQFCQLTGKNAREFIKTQFNTLEITKQLIKEYQKILEK